METLGHGSYGEVKKIQLKSTKEYRAMKIISKEDVGLQYAGALEQKSRFSSIFTTLIYKVVMHA